MPQVNQAMILDATSQFSFYTGAMGEDGYGYFKIPIPDGATGDEASTIVTGGSENYAISAETKHPDEAVKFLKFLTKKAQAEKQTKETGLPNAIIGGITEDNSDAVIAAAYKHQKTIMRLPNGLISVLMEMFLIPIWQAYRKL